MSHNAPFRTEMSTFLLWMEHYGIWNRCIPGFVNLLYWDIQFVPRVRLWVFCVKPMMTEVYVVRPQRLALNSLAPERWGSYYTSVVSNPILRIDIQSTSCEIARMWVSQNPFDNESKLFQVIDWHHQATSHYVSQCWPRSMSSFHVTRPQHNELLAPDFVYIASVISWVKKK